MVQAERQELLLCREVVHLVVPRGDASSCFCPEPLDELLVVADAEPEFAGFRLPVAREEDALEVPGSIVAEEPCLFCGEREGGFVLEPPFESRVGGES